MPTYEYVCEKCNHKFDIFQSIKDESLKTCPKEKCGQKTWGKGKIRRVIGAGAGLIFKGSGFYITDYRSESYKQAAKKESGGEAKPASTSESRSSGSESKSTTAPKAKTPKSDKS